MQANRFVDPPVERATTKALSAPAREAPAAIAAPSPGFGGSSLQPCSTESETATTDPSSASLTWSTADDDARCGVDAECSSLICIAAVATPPLASEFENDAAAPALAGNMVADFVTFYNRMNAECRHEQGYDDDPEPEDADLTLAPASYTAQAGAAEDDACLATSDSVAAAALGGGDLDSPPQEDAGPLALDIGWATELSFDVLLSSVSENEHAVSTVNPTLRKLSAALLDETGAPGTTLGDCAADALLAVLIGGRSITRALRSRRSGPACAVRLVRGVRACASKSSRCVPMMKEGRGGRS